MRQRDDWHLTDSIEHEQGRGDPFAAAVRATRMPMVITDPRQPDNPIVFCNEAFQKLTGYGRDEILGHNCRFLQGANTDREAVTRVRAAIEAERPIDIDLLNYRKDGSTFWNALYLSPVRSDDGTLQFFFASQLDVSERVEAQALIAEQKAVVEREVERRTADLKAALEAQTLLLHEVDHRVKNNLTMIGALIRLQARSTGDPAIAAKLEAMLQRVDALATVHRRLYQSDDVTRFDIGTFAGTLLADVIGASGRDDIVVEAAIEPIDVGSEKAAALGLVLNEVLTNAVKHAYADGRPGVLKVAARKDEDRASIEVCDDGPGMRDDGAALDGLGRTLITRLSRQVGASADWADAGPGTRVTISFPGRAEVVSRSPILKVLVVEDEALLAYDIEAMVEDAGHRVVGEAASLGDVELLSDDLAPDIAFVDIQLAEGSSGLDVSRHIRARWAAALVIFITANPLKIPPDYAGGHGVIPKPFSRTGLVSALRYIGEGVLDPPPAMPRPQSLIAAPALASSWGG